MFVFKKIYDLEYDEMDAAIEKMLLTNFPKFWVLLEIVVNIPIGIACIGFEIFKIFHQISLSFLGTG